jgi:hypothetical protein
MATALLGHACGKHSGPPTAAPASASAQAAESAPPEQKAAPRPPPPDIDLAQFEKPLGCPALGGKAAPGGKKACAVIADFAKAGRWTSHRPSGEERWFGRAYVIEKGKERDEYGLLVSRTVPTARVGPDDLPFMISFAPLPMEFQYEAGKLWSTMSHGVRHRGPKKSPANRYVEAYIPTGERGVANTAGPSVVLITELSEDTAYLRRESMKRLLLVRPAKAANADPGDGTYAEFWQATW